MNDQTGSNETTDPSVWPDTDDAPSHVVLSVLGQCAILWEPGARLVGNVRACDIARATDEAKLLRATLQRIVDGCDALQPGGATKSGAWAAEIAKDALHVER